MGSHLNPRSFAQHTKHLAVAAPSLMMYHAVLVPVSLNGCNMCLSSMCFLYRIQPAALYVFIYLWFVFQIYTTPPATAVFCVSYKCAWHQV